MIAHPLPPSFAENLRSLHTPDHRRYDSRPLRYTIAAAKERGWTYVAIANALHISRERARQLGSIAQPRKPFHLLFPIPTPPPRSSSPPPVAPLRLRAEAVSEIRRLHQLGRPGTREFAALMQTYRRAGYEMRHLAAVIGTNSHTLRNRLRRAGYPRKDS